MAAPKNLFLLLLLLLSSVLLLSPVTSGRSTTRLGVVYRYRPGNPNPEYVVSRLPAYGITHVHLPDPSRSTVKAFEHTNVDLTISMPNSLIPDLARNLTKAREWIADHITPYYPNAQVLLLSVGNAIPSVTQDLLDAIINVKKACDPHIHVTTSLSFSVLNNPLPPSAAYFRPDPSVPKVLSYLNSIGSPILFEIIPFELRMKEPPAMALFDGRVSRTDQGLTYNNLFDEMLDAAFTALGKAGYNKMKVSVSGTGWPTAGAPDATLVNAGKYNKNLLNHLKTVQGTPLSPDGAVEVFVNELLDDPQAPPPEWHQHMGIWYPNNLTSKFDAQPASKKNGAQMRSGFGMAAGFVGMALLSLLV